MVRGDSLLSTTTELTYTIGTKDVILTAKALSAPDDDFDPLHPDDPAMKAVHIHAVSANKAMGKAYGSAICVEGKRVKIGAKAPMAIVLHVGAMVTMTQYALWLPSKTPLILRSLHQKYSV